MKEMYSDDSDDSYDFEYSGDKDFGDYGLEVSHDMNTTGNNNQSMSGTDSEIAAETPIPETDNSVVVIFGIVGGIVFLICLTLLLCIVWTRRRRPSPDVSQQKNDRRSIASVDAETIRNGPRGFNHVVYGYGNNFEDSVILSRTAAEGQINNQTHVQNEEKSRCQKPGGMAQLSENADSEEANTPNQNIPKETSIRDEEEGRHPKSDDTAQHSENSYIKQTDKSIQNISKGNIHKTQYETCFPCTQNHKRTRNKINLQRYAKCTRNIHNSRYDNKTGSIRSVMKTDSKGKKAKPLLRQDEISEICLFEDDYMLNTPPPSPCRSDEVTDYICTEIHTEFIGDAAQPFLDQTEVSDIHSFIDDYTLNAPPPSPCKSDAGIDCTNFPGNASVKQNCTGYVNLSDDMKLDTKDEAKRQCKRSFDKMDKLQSLSDPNLSASEAIEGATAPNYVNALANLDKPPRYEELSFKTRKRNSLEKSGDREMQSGHDYENTQNQKFEIKDKSPFKADLNAIKSGLTNNRHSEFDPGQYLSMDVSCEKENEYIPIDNPDTLNAYEKSILHPKNCRLQTPSGYEIKSMDEAYTCTPEYVNTQNILYIPQRSSSCDSVYSYADPYMVCPLYRDRNRLTKRAGHTKSRALNRSKTFSPADSKERPLHVACQRRPLKQTESAERKLSQFGEGQQEKVTADIKQKCVEGISRLTDHGYVNTGPICTEKHRSHTKVSKLPVSTKRKSLGEIKYKSQNDGIKTPFKPSNIPVSTYRRGSGETNYRFRGECLKMKITPSKAEEHDYENEIPKKVILHSGPEITKPKKPAVLPKPKALNKIPNQVSTTLV